MGHRALVQWVQLDLMDPRVIAEIIQEQAQRVAGTDFIAAIRADQQQVALLTRVDYAAKQIEGGTVTPLQVVQKQHDRVASVGEHAQERGEHQLQTVATFGRGQLDDCRLLADDQRQFRHQVDHQGGVGAQGTGQALAPQGELLPWLQQDLLHQCAEGGGQGGVGLAALVLVELALHQKAAFADLVGVYLVDQCRLAHAGIAVDQAEAGLSLYRLLEQVVQGLQLLVAAIERLRHQKFLQLVLLAEREGQQWPVVIQSRGAQIQIM